MPHFTKPLSVKEDSFLTQKKRLHLAWHVHRHSQLRHMMGGSLYLILWECLVSSRCRVSRTNHHNSCWVSRTRANLSAALAMAVSLQVPVTCNLHWTLLSIVNWPSSFPGQCFAYQYDADTKELPDLLILGNRNLDSSQQLWIVSIAFTDKTPTLTKLPVTKLPNKCTLLRGDDSLCVSITVKASWNSTWALAL